MALVALFATGLIEPLPKAALGVVVVAAALTLFDLSGVLATPPRPRRRGCTVGCGDGLVLGVLGGVALSIGVFVYRSSRPHDAVLGEVTDVDGYRDVARWESAELITGLVVYRFDAPLFFPNAEYFRRRVRELVAAEQTTPPSG